MPAEPYQPRDRRPVGNFHSVPDDDLVFAPHDMGRAPAERTTPSGDGAAAAADPLPGISFVAAAQPPAPPEPPASMSFVEPAPPAPLPGISFAEPAQTSAPPVGSMDAFHLTASGGSAAATPDLPWITRDPVPVRPESAREGWRRRWSDEVDRAASASMKALRNEALHVTWKAALTAVMTAGTDTGAAQQR